MRLGRKALVLVEFLSRLRGVGSSERRQFAALFVIWSYTAISAVNRRTCFLRRASHVVVIEWLVRFEVMPVSCDRLQEVGCMMLALR